MRANSLDPDRSVPCGQAWRWHLNCDEAGDPELLNPVRPGHRPAPSLPDCNKPPCQGRLLHSSHGADTHGEPLRGTAQ